MVWKTSDVMTKNIITKIEAFNVRVPLGRPLKLGAIEIPYREYVIVCIHDDDGNRGISYGLNRNAPIAEVIHQSISGMWLKKNVVEHGHLYDLTLKANICLGTNGIFFRALSLFDCALYDLMAIQVKIPLYKFLGGTSRLFPVMLVGGYPVPDENRESLEREMKLFGSYNPSGVKIASTTIPELDRERLSICREYLSDDIPLMIDCVWAQRDARKFAKEVQKWGDLNMGWIEDPFLPDDYDSIRYLSEKTRINVAVGDEQSGYLNMLRLMDLGKINVLRLDATVCGGIRAFMKIADEAHKRDIPVACHIFHQTHMHLACAHPAVKWIEYMLPESDIESYHRLWEQDLKLENGHFFLTEESGIGTKWNNSAIAHYRIEK